MDRPTNRDFDDDDFRLPYGDGTDAFADWLANGDDEDELAIPSVREELRSVRELLEKLTEGISELRATVADALAKATKSPA